MAQVKVDKRLLEGMTKRERQAFVREFARQERERLARQRRRNRILGWSAAGAVAVVAVVGGTAAAIVSSNAAAAEAARGPENMLSDGLLLESAGDGETVTPVSTVALEGEEQPVANTSDVATTGVLDIQVYLDLTTSDAATFWSMSGATLESYLTAGYVSLELHPIAQSGTDDALAAVSAFGCVAALEPGVALASWDALLQVGIDGLADGTTLGSDDLATALTTGGASEDVVECADAERYAMWAQAASTRASTSIPYATDAAAGSAVTVTAGGTVYSGALDDADAFTAFLESAYTAATTVDDGTTTE